MIIGLHHFGGKSGAKAEKQKKHKRLNYDEWHEVWNDAGWVPSGGHVDPVDCLAGKTNQKVTPGVKRRIAFWIFIAGFITNLIWENAQAPLYSGYEGFGQHFLFCLISGIVDGIVVLGFYFVISLIRKSLFWLFNIKPLDILTLSILGLITAVLFEKWALKNDSWNYAEEMPLIFGMGLLPLLQLAVLSIISVFIVRLALPRKIMNKKYNRAGSEG